MSRNLMHLNDVAQKFDAQLNLKMPKALLTGLQEIKESHGLEPAEILRRLGEAAVEFYHREKYFAFPVRIFPETEFLSNVVKTSETGADRVRLKASEAARAEATGRRTG